jgi:two-component system invasion response regulator UvrY
MERSVAVMLIDGNSGIRLGLAQRLQQMPGIAIVGESGDPGEALTMVRVRRPDVVVLDLHGIAPDPKGFLRRLRVTASETEVVVLTSYIAWNERAALSQAGAWAILMKEIDSDALARAIRSAASRDGPKSAA